LTRRTRDHRVTPHARPGRTTGPDSNAEQHLRIASAILDAAGVFMGPRRMHTLTRRYVAGRGFTFQEWFLVQLQLEPERTQAVRCHPDVERYFLPHLDPTGEQAIRNLLTGGAR
jgi:hypothetical protein